MRERGHHSAEAGIHPAEDRTGRATKRLVSHFHGNDRRVNLRTFSEAINFGINNIDIPVSNFYHTKMVDWQSKCLKARIRDSRPFSF